MTGVIGIMSNLNFKLEDCSISIEVASLVEGVDFYYHFSYVFDNNRIIYVFADVYEKDYSNNPCKSKKWNRYNRLRKSLRPFWDTNKPEALKKRLEELIKEKEEIDKVIDKVEEKLKEA